VSRALALNQTNPFNWVRLQSSWEQARNWNARQQALRQQQEYRNEVTNTLAKAADGENQGVMNLIVKQALARTQAAAQKKADSVLASANDTSPVKPAKDTSPVTLRDGTVIKVDEVQYLPGGSKLNLKTGILTLPNGTLVDTQTGARKVNVTV
jgi:hypothetical protein